VTDKQRRYIIYLASELGLAVDDYGWRASARHRYGLTQREARWGFSVGEASQIIKRLQRDLSAKPEVA
jgi:hypothetical protein